MAAKKKEAKQKIIRRPDRAEGDITDEERVLLEAHAQKWIKIIMRTEPIEPERIKQHIKELYVAAKLRAPETVIVVPSPLALALGSGLTQAAFERRKDESGFAPGTIKDDVSMQWGVSIEGVKAMYRALDETGAAVDFGDEGTYNTGSLDYDVEMPDGWGHSITNQLFPDNPAHAVEAVKNSWRMRFGGNHSAQYDSFLTACRDIIGLRLESHGPYKAWEMCAIHGSWRVLQEDFAMVSDFPSAIRTDDRNEPHCEDGPSHAWRDGWELFHWHGTRVPRQWIMDTESVDPALALNHPNIEERRCLAEIMGWDTVLKLTDARIVAKDKYGELLEVTLPDSDGVEKFVRVKCATGRTFALPVQGTVTTAHEAVASTFEMTADEYHPRVQT